MPDYTYCSSKRQGMRLSNGMLDKLTGLGDLVLCGNQPVSRPRLQRYHSSPHCRGALAPAWLAKVDQFLAATNNPDGKPAWRRLRRGVADVHRRAQVCQASNERYLDALVAADTSVPFGYLVRDIRRPTTWNGKRVRALRAWSEQDQALFRAVSRGEFCINGFRNRDLQSLLFKDVPETPEEARRRSARVTRLLRLLRAHHLIQKVPRTHRYVLSTRGRQIVSAVLSAQRVTLDQLNKLAA